MTQWILALTWIALGVLLGALMFPVVGKGAFLVPVGWCVGSVLGGCGGAIFTIGSHRRDRRLRRTFSAAIGAGMMAVFLGVWSLEVASEPLTIWKIAVAALGAIVVPPVAVVLCFEINDVLRR